MKSFYFLIRLLLGFYFASLSSGCGKKAPENQTLTPAQAASELEQVFNQTTPTLAQHVQTATQALQANQYEQAFNSISILESQPNLTYEQTLAAQRSMQSLQLRLAQAVVDGDTNALRLVEQMRRRGP